MSEGLSRVDPPVSLELGVTMRPRIEGGVRPSSDSISYSQWRAGGRDRNNGPLLNALSPDSPDTDDVVNAFDDSPSTQEVIDAFGPVAIHDMTHGGSPVAGPSNMSPAQTRKRARTEAQAGDAAGSQDSTQTVGPSPTVEAAAPASGSGHNSSSDGGFDSAQGPESFLPKGGYSTQSGMMIFRKVHRMKSWAIPYWNVARNGYRSGANLVTTPLAKIPWEYAFFYLSPEEFDMFPNLPYALPVKRSANLCVSAQFLLTLVTFLHLWQASLILHDLLLT